MIQTSRLSPNAYAESEFEKYRIIQDRLFQSDFDRFEDNSPPVLDIE